MCVLFILTAVLIIVKAYAQKVLTLNYNFHVRLYKADYLNILYMLICTEYGNGTIPHTSRGSRHLLESILVDMYIK